MSDIKLPATLIFEQMQKDYSMPVDAAYLVIADLQQQNKELREACNSFRDSVLHQRWNLEGNGMTSEHINDVLNVFDTIVGDELATATSKGGGE